MSSAMKMPLSGRRRKSILMLVTYDYPGALDAEGTSTAQLVTKSSMLVKTQTNTGWKNLKDDLAVHFHKLQ